MHHDDHHADPASLNLGQTVRDLGPGADRWPLLVGLVGLGGAVIAAVLRGFFIEGENPLERFLFSYLHNYLYFLSITHGALFFVLVHHLSRAGWSVTVRRVAEVMAANVWIFALMFLPILAIVWSRSGLVYPWTDPDYLAENPAVAAKAGYFNVPFSPDSTIPLFFTLRAVLYFAIWILLARSFYRASLRQDETGDEMISKRLEGRSAWGTLVAFLSVSFASIDWAMTLDPTWFSTMFGVYYIAGCAVTFFAALWVIVYVLQSRGVLQGAVNVEHQHDIGKYIFGFIVFWSYITFCQFLLYWYGDIPEETRWYLVRISGSWKWVGVFLILGNFAIPLFGTMSRHVKRNRKALLFWSVWMLVAHWIDVQFIVMPEAVAFEGENTRWAFGLIDVLMFLGIGGLTVYGLVRTAAGHALVPVRDPRLHESLVFHNV
jgi:hypothetical protein